MKSDLLNDFSLVTREVDYTCKITLDWLGGLRGDNFPAEISSI